MSVPLQGISSMATRQVLAELLLAWQARSGDIVHLESVGGVSAAQRVRAGEAFDLAFLASDAIDSLIADGHVLGGSRVDLMRSSTVVAVPAHGSVPSIHTEEALRRQPCRGRKPSDGDFPSLRFSVSPTAPAPPQEGQEQEIPPAGSYPRPRGADSVRARRRSFRRNTQAGTPLFRR